MHMRGSGANFTASGQSRLAQTLIHRLLRLRLKIYPHNCMTSLWRGVFLFCVMPQSKMIQHSAVGLLVNLSVDLLLILETIG
jgi:hypothetical protein